MIYALYGNVTQVTVTAKRLIFLKQDNASSQVINSSYFFSIAFDELSHCSVCPAFMIIRFIVFQNSVSQCWKVDHGCCDDGDVIE